MALNQNFSNASILLDLGGEVVGQLAGADLGSIKAVVVAPPATTGAPVKETGGAPEYGDCTVVTGLAESDRQLGWLAGLWRKEPVEKSGAIILADLNFRERRRATFTDAVVTSVTFDDLDVNSAKTPYRLTYTFAPGTLAFESGTGVQVKGALGIKQKAAVASNFRIRMGALPCDRVARVSGLSVTAEFDTEHEGSPRVPNRRLVNTSFGDLTLTLSGDDRVFAEWNKYATKTLQDGITSETERLTCVIDWFDPALKAVMGTLTLQGCALKEFRFDAMDTQARSGLVTFVAVFSVDRFAPEGLVLAR